MFRPRIRAEHILIIMAMLFAAYAHSHVELSPLNYYYDATGTLTLEEFVARIESSEFYEPFEGAQVPVGHGAHWLFGDVKRLDTDVDEQWLLEINFPNIDRVETFVLGQDGSVDRFVVGDEVAFSDWPNNYRQPSIPLNMAPLSQSRVVFKVSSETPLIFPVSITSKQAQMVTQRGEHFLYGLFYGSIFILALYNAGVYFSLRDRSYLYYVLYILSFALVQASTTGMAQQYLWPDLQGVTTRAALFAIALTNYFMLLFVIHFLDLRSHAPGLVRPLQVIAWIALLCVPALLLPLYAYTQYMIHGTNMLSMIVIAWVISRVFSRNRRSTTYLLVGYSVLFSAIILALLFQANLIAHHAYIDFSMSAAIIFEAIVLSIGLSERIAQLRFANEKSERDQRIAQEELSQRLIKARESERAQMSKHLHDSVNHDLIVAQRKLSALVNAQKQPDPGVTSEIERVEALLGSTIEEIRNVSHASHPHAVKHLGLDSAICALLKSAFGSTIMWDVHIEGVPLHEDVQLLLYRVVQEGTNNIIKHADATECLVRLQLNQHNSELLFFVKDDGRGFPASSVTWGFGLLTLNEHCKSLGGRFTVDSSPGDGTTLNVVLPYAGGESLHG